MTMLLRFGGAPIALFILFLATPISAVAQSFNMRDYWLMPHGLYGNLTTFFRSGGSCNGGSATGTHAFWRGTFLGKTVALQGGIVYNQENSAFDIFEVGANSILYWGTFRGNALNSQSQKSNAFSNALTFMPNTMNVNVPHSHSVTDNEMLNNHRKKNISGPFSHTLIIEAHLASFFDSESGRTWLDVLQVLFTQPGGNERYWLAKGKGTVRFESYDPNEPSCVDHQYATTFQNYSPAAAPTIPWYDPFKFATYAPNGFFEDHLIAPMPGGAPLSLYERSWTGVSNGTTDSQDVAITEDAPNSQTSTWKVALRAVPTSGYDFAVSASIPVTANKTYRLSGWLYRVSGSDQVYLDLNDIPGDLNIGTSSTNAWQMVSGQINVGSKTSVKVRCVRDGANAGNAYCDGITLQRVN